MAVAVAPALVRKNPTRKVRTDLKARRQARIMARVEVVVVCPADESGKSRSPRPVLLRRFERNGKLEHVLLLGTNHCREDLTKHSHRREK